MNYFSDIDNKYKRYIEIGFGIIVLYGVLYNYTQLINNITYNYFPVWSDEFFYFINTNSFFQNNTLEAALTYNGRGSHVLGADAHGFGYPLLYGSIANVFGWSNLNFIYFNFISVSISILLIWCVQFITITQKIWISNIILMFPFFLLYGFTFMQESIHVFIGLVISVLVYCLYTREDNRIYIGLFLITILIAGVFRALWFFWLIGLIPLAKSKKQFVIYFLLFLFGIISSFLFVRFFTEPVPNYFSSVVTVIVNNRIGEGLGSLITHFYENLYIYFFGTKGDLVYKSIKYMNFGIVAYFSYIAIKNKSRLMIAIALIGVSNFLLLFILYDVFDWREIRAMSPLFYFYILFIVIFNRKELTYFFVIVLCCLFFPTLKISKQWMQGRNSIQNTAYDEIAEKIERNKLVLVGYRPRDYSTDLLDLPLRNISGDPIRYVIPYYKVEKKHCDYTILRPNTTSQNVKIIDNKYYSLVDNSRKKSEQPKPERNLSKSFSFEQYVELSLMHYQNKEYLKSIEVLKKAVSLNATNSIVYNNLCSAYNRLLMYDEAKIAGERSLKINQNVSLTKNNLKESLIGIERIKNQGLAPEEYLTLSFNYYKLGNFEKSINVSLKLLELEPNNAIAYNNICSAYNAIGKYEKAIKACEKALEIDPSYQLAKNNLKQSKDNFNH